MNLSETERRPPIGDLGLWKVLERKTEFLLRAIIIGLALILVGRSTGGAVAQSTQLRIASPDVQETDLSTISAGNCQFFL